MAKIVIGAYCAEHMGYMAKLIPYLKGKGHVVNTIMCDIGYDSLRGAGADVVIAWNGARPENKDTMDWFREGERQGGCRILFAEVGWFPGASLKGAGKTMYLDRKGINADSEIRDFRLPHYRPHMREEVERYISGLAGKDYRESGDCTLVPLQLPGDTNLTNHAPYFSDVQALIDHLSRDGVLPAADIVFKRHPRDSTEYKVTAPNARLVTEGDIYQLLLESCTVIGVNSTVLLEALAMGREVYAFGYGLYSGHGVIRQAAPGLPVHGGKRSAPAGAELVYTFLYELIFRRQILLEDGRITESLDRNRVLQETLRMI